MPEYMIIKMKKVSAIISIFVITFLLSIDSYAQGNRERIIENRIAEAVEKYSARDFGSASAILRSIIATAPENDAAHYYLGLTEFCLNHMDTAEHELAEAVRLDPDNYWYRYRLAMLYSATDRKELTAAMFEELLKDFPKKNELYYSLIELYMSQGQTEKALGTLTQIETLFGADEAVALTRFDLLRRLGRYEEAYGSLTSFSRENPSPQVLSILGDYQMSMYNDSLALKSYDEALSLSPDYAPAILGKAETFRVTRRYDEYFPLVRRFIRSGEISPEGKGDYLTNLFRRADPMFLKTFSAELDSLMTDCISVHPKDSSILMAAGIYYYGTGRAQEASGYFQENMRLYPESLSATANYVELLMYTHSWTELSSEGRKAYRKFPSEPAFLEMASLADYNLGDYRKVLGICDTVLAVCKGDSLKTLNAYTTMGDMYHQLGENKKAYQAYDKALGINPRYVPVLNNYAYFLSMEGKQLKKAYAMSKITVEQEPDNPTYLDTFGWILYLQGKPLEAKPFFKHAMLYGGKDSAVILDHYAEVLYALKEYDLAFVYWMQAQARNDGEIEGLDEKIRQRKSEMNR